ncbi:MAG: hypothetical protein WDO72_07260 [Pseudomonadota bacterium]
MKTPIAALAGAAALTLLGACARQEQVREIDWAKAALARNPAFEIIATDDSAGVFTVRDTVTGTVHTLRLEDLIATPLPAKSASTPAAPAPMLGGTSAAESEPSTVASAGAPADQITEDAEPVPPSHGKAVSEGPGFSISRGGDRTVAGNEAALEGPGYSITRNEPMKGMGASHAEAVASNVEKRTDPIICQGDRLMRIDGETIEFTGDALIVEKGCDLYISNTNIRAGGVGIIARQARVHIVNSSIGGTRGSYEASEGAEIYVARSTFTGVGRRFDSATMNDLGGNAYQTH